MIGTDVFAVFALGLRHGADPDHIAAIDNMTRNSFEKKPWLSRFVGTLFAGGHSIMVLSIAALVGIVGSHLGSYGATIERIGTWISIAVLIAIALLNLQQMRGGGVRPVGVKSRLMPKALREATSPWVAVPVGLLFGFGFETSSQIATFAIGFGVNSGVVGALLVGAAFCFGMICTDTLDSVLVHRLVSARTSMQPRAMRVWIATVTAVALAVAAYELAQVLGWQSPVPDIYVSAAIVAVLLCVFAYVFAQTRRVHVEPVPQPGTIS